MRTIGLWLAAAAALGIGAPAEATIVNFNVTGAGTGTFSWDDTANLLTGASLTFGSASFTIANTGSQFDGTEYVIGGTLNGVGTDVNNTDDFFFGFDPTLASQSSVFLVWTNAGGPNHSFDQSVTITQAGAAVPEPASWAMMLLGFLGVGLTMRRAPRAAALV
jgi:hypothetical protein